MAKSQIRELPIPSGIFVEGCTRSRDGQKVLNMSNSCCQRKLDKLLVFASGFTPSTYQGANFLLIGLKNFKKMKNSEGKITAQYLINQYFSDNP